MQDDILHIHFVKEENALYKSIINFDNLIESREKYRIEEKRKGHELSLIYSDRFLGDDQIKRELKERIVYRVIDEKLVKDEKPYTVRDEKYSHRWLENRGPGKFFVVYELLLNQKDGKVMEERGVFFDVPQKRHYESYPFYVPHAKVARKVESQKLELIDVFDSCGIHHDFSPIEIYNQIVPKSLQAD